jgi:hypothetical protein
MIGCVRLDRAKRMKVCCCGHIIHQSARLCVKCGRVYTPISAWLWGLFLPLLGILAVAYSCPNAYGKGRHFGKWDAFCSASNVWVEGLSDSDAHSLLEGPQVWVRINGAPESKVSFEIPARFHLVPRGTPGAGVLEFQSPGATDPSASADSFGAQVGSYVIHNLLLWPDGNDRRLGSLAWRKQIREFEGTRAVATDSSVHAWQEHALKSDQQAYFQLMVDFTNDRVRHCR